MGIQLPVYAAPEAWEQIVRNAPYACMQTLADAVDNTLKQVGGHRADFAHIDFKWFMPLDDEGRATKRVRLRAKLYWSEEVEQVWIHLSQSPERFRQGPLAA